MIPKFRAWHIHKQIMCEVIRINFKQEIVTLDLETDDDEYYCMETDWNFDEVILMQSTGLTDMNGTMIYEGDIVQMQWTIYDKPELFYIRTIEGRAPRVDNRIKGKELWLVHQDCKVVGNIYQNCELLEVAE